MHLFSLTAKDKGMPRSFISHEKRTGPTGGDILPFFISRHNGGYYPSFPTFQFSMREKKSVFWIMTCFLFISSFRSGLST